MQKDLHDRERSSAEAKERTMNVHVFGCNDAMCRAGLQEHKKLSCGKTARNEKRSVGS
jgi:hypothetical protein